MSFSGSVKPPLLLELFQGMDDMDEDMRLNILVVRDSFLSFLSSFLSSPSWLWIDLDSLIRRPKLLHVLSEDVREGAWLCSRECDDEVSRDAGGSCFGWGGLMGGAMAWWWSMIRGLWWRSRGVLSVGIAKVGFMVRSSRTIRAVTWTDSGFSAPCCTLYTVALIGPEGFLSIMDAEDEGRSSGLPLREADNPFGDVSRGDEAKKEDLR